MSGVIVIIATLLIALATSFAYPSVVTYVNPLLCVMAMIIIIHCDLNKVAEPIPTIHLDMADFDL